MGRVCGSYVKYANSQTSNKQNEVSYGFETCFTAKDAHEPPSLIQLFLPIHLDYERMLWLASKWEYDFRQ